jgi:hypothetical protein
MEGQREESQEAVAAAAAWKVYGEPRVGSDTRLCAELTITHGMKGGESGLSMSRRRWE